VANKEPEERKRTYYNQQRQTGTITARERTLAGGRQPILIPVHVKRL
jgi:hypothetical protein